MIRAAGPGKIRAYQATWLECGIKNHKGNLVVARMKGNTVLYKRIELIIQVGHMLYACGGYSVSKEKHYVVVQYWAERPRGMNSNDVHR